jgi:uncharacterized protein YdbL (DUF1318 family)
MKKHTFKLLIVGFIFSVCFADAVLADINDVQDRMLKRVPAVNELKNSEIIGENNRGFLSFLGKNKKGQNTVKDENNDRRVVYRSIAQKRGIKPEQVGQLRAKMFAQKGKSGWWFQSPDGKWYKKK